MAQHSGDDSSDQEATWRERLPDSSLFQGVTGGVRGVSPTTLLPNLLKGTVRFVWPLAIGLAVVAAIDQVDPRRQIEYSRLVTEIPLTAAIGIGVLGVVVRAVSGGTRDWPSAGVVIRTTVLLALLVGVFALLGPTGVI